MKINVKVIETSSWSLNDYYEDDDITIKFKCDHEWKDNDEGWFTCDEEQCAGIAEHEQNKFFEQYVDDLDDSDFQYDSWRDFNGL